MAADFFTKPVQGALFWKFCNWILNLNEDDVLRYMRQEENGLANKSKLSHRSVLSIEDSNNDEHMENGQTSKYGPRSLVTTEVANGRNSCLVNGKSSCSPTG